jgi:hypothetical protein
MFLRFFNQPDRNLHTLANEDLSASVAYSNVVRLAAAPLWDTLRTAMRTTGSSVPVGAVSGGFGSSGGCFPFATTSYPECECVQCRYTLQELIWTVVYS